MVAVPITVQNTTRINWMRRKGWAVFGAVRDSARLWSGESYCHDGPFSLWGCGFARLASSEHLRVASMAYDRPAWFSFGLSLSSELHTWEFGLCMFFWVIALFVYTWMFCFATALYI